jgi:hypothetical protein
MELIERYLQAVKFALPQEQREDIIKELRDNLLSQIEEKEAELGHLDKCRLEMTGVRKADTTPKVGVKECNRLLTTVIVELVGNSA